MVCHPAQDPEPNDFGSLAEAPAAPLPSDAFAATGVQRTGANSGHGLVPGWVNDVSIAITVALSDAYLAE